MVMRGLTGFSSNTTEVDMMTSTWFFCLACLVLGKTDQTRDVDIFVHQEKRFISVKVGGNLTLRCSYRPDVGTRFYWYKQILGQKLRLISSFYKFNGDITFSSEFRNMARFTVDTIHHINELNISDLHTSDSGTYYCASSYSEKFDFGRGTTVSVEGSDVDVQTLVHQSGSESIRAGDSVTLNCTVHTGSCDGEHSVYWFRNSGRPQPGIIYTHGGRNDQCERRTDSHTPTCVYNLPIQTMNHSHAGTFYCAVALCGQVLFGNGAKGGFEKESLLLVYFLSGGLGFTTVFIVLLSISVYKMKRKSNVHFSESQPRYPANTEDNSDADSLHYAALSIRAPNTSRRQRNAYSSECVYSSVKK